MKFCQNCGQGNEDSAIFCLRCGEKITSESTISPEEQRTGAPQPPGGIESTQGSQPQPGTVPPPTGLGPLSQPLQQYGLQYQQASYLYRKNDGYAIASLVIGILSFFICGIVGGILAVVFSQIAMRNIEESGGTLTGESYAKAGSILGWINICFYSLLIILFIIIQIAVR
ncbi:MAG: DUF4190 domain-containing protein [Actinomycetota bacterium]|nr:DUF4190 domain-containing protein [Actinomycetota bacterium]